MSLSLQHGPAIVEPRPVAYFGQEEPLMARVLMINPLVRQEDVPQHVPYGLALLASIIETAGHQYQVYDANAWRASEGTISQLWSTVVGTCGCSRRYWMMSSRTCSSTR